MTLPDASPVWVPSSPPAPRTWWRRPRRFAPSRPALNSLRAHRLQACAATSSKPSASIRGRPVSCERNHERDGHELPLQRWGLSPHAIPCRAGVRRARRLLPSASASRAPEVGGQALRSERRSGAHGMRGQPLQGDAGPLLPHRRMAARHRRLHPDLRGTHQPALRQGGQAS